MASASPILQTAVTDLPSAPELESPPRANPWWRVALPHILTALAAVALTLLITSLLPQQSPAFIPPVRPTAAPTLSATAAPTAQPTELPPAPDERVVRQEIIDLRARLDYVWASMYVARAAAQLGDAEEALRRNDTAEVERVLTAVDASLQLAYERSSQVNRGPVGELRAQVGQIRDDLHVRPEGTDLRLRSLRQVMMSLVEEP